jgi:hypothetical protein
MRRFTAGSVAMVAAALLASCTDVPAPTAVPQTGPSFIGGGATPAPAGSIACSSTAASGLGLHAAHGWLVINAPTNCDVLQTGVPVHVSFTYQFNFGRPSGVSGQYIPDTNWVYVSEVYDDGHVTNTLVSNDLRDGFTPFDVNVDVTPAANVDRIVISVGHNSQEPVIAAGDEMGQDREFVVDLWKPIPTPTLVSDTVSAAGAPFGTITFGPIRPRTKGILRQSCDGGAATDVLFQHYAVIPTPTFSATYRPTRYGCTYVGTVYSNVGSGNDAIGQNIAVQEWVAGTTNAVVHGSNPPPPPDTTTVVDSTPSHPASNILTSVQQGWRPFGLAVSATGRAVVTLLDTTGAATYNVATRAYVGTIGAGTTPGSAAIYGNTAYIGNQGSSSVSIVNIVTGAMSQPITLTASPYYVALSRSGTRLLVTANDGKLRIYNTASNALMATLTVGTTPNGVAVSGDTLAFVSVAGTGRVKRINLVTNTVRDSVTPGGVPQELAISKDGTRLFVANESGRIDAYDVSNFGSKTTVTVAGAFGLAVTPDGQQLYVTQPSSASVTVLASPSLAFIRSVSISGKPRRVRFDSVGKTAVISNEQYQVNFIR